LTSPDELITLRLLSLAVSILRKKSKSGLAANHALAAFESQLRSHVIRRLMSKEPPSPEAFQKLLRWLNPDPEKAGQKYEQIRLRLIRFLTSRGCWEAEDLVDQTFNVVASKIDWLIENYDKRDPALYFYGVAKNLYWEWLKRQTPPPSPPPPPDTDEIERKCACLDQCLKQEATPDERIWVLRYYAKDKQERIRERKKIAEELGLSMNALRIKVYHFISRLRPCVEKCWERLSK
jgi:DNA-directed RNA polymerase specialized sigma24 family protein